MMMGATVLDLYKSWSFLTAYSDVRSGLRDGVCGGADVAIKTFLQPIKRNLVYSVLRFYLLVGGGCHLRCSF